MNAIKIEDWAVVYLPTASHRSPEQTTKHLRGRVQSHPQRPAKAIVTTSSLVGCRGNMAKNGHAYELGKIRTEYEAQFPNALERFLKTLAEL